MIGATLAIYLLTGLYVVNPGEQAVIRRFGAPQLLPVSEGLHYRLPYPIDTVEKVNVSEVRRTDIGMTLPDHLHQKDDILSTEKVAAQNAVLELAQKALDRCDAGIQITAFNIQEIVPPNAVFSAFLDVTAAKEDRETSINEANGYTNSLIPQARADANKTVSDAEAYKAEQISRATGDTEKFLSMLAEYQKNSAIYTADTTKYRLLLETLEKILPNVKLYIVDSADGTVNVKLFDESLSGNASVALGNS